MTIATVVGHFACKTRPHSPSSTPIFTRCWLKRSASIAIYNRSLEIQQILLLPKTFPHIEDMQVAAVSMPGASGGGIIMNFIAVDAQSLGFRSGTFQAREFLVRSSWRCAVARFTPRPWGTVPCACHLQVNRVVPSRHARGHVISMIYRVLNVSCANSPFVAWPRALLLHRVETRIKSAHRSRHGAGIDSGKVFDSLTEEKQVSSKGDVLVFYTDGVTETLDDEPEIWSQSVKRNGPPAPIKRSRNHGQY